MSKTYGRKKSLNQTGFQSQPIAFQGFADYTDYMLCAIGKIRFFKDVAAFFASFFLLLGAFHAAEPAPQSEIDQLKAIAAKGDATAQRNLGWMYSSGHNVEKNFVEAAKWFRKAAEQGDSWSQLNLGHLYYHGHGVASDPVEAYKWFRLSYETGLASRWWPDEYEDVSERLTPAQLDQARRLIAAFRHEEYPPPGERAVAHEPPAESGRTTTNVKRETASVPSPTPPPLSATTTESPGAPPPSPISNTEATPPNIVTEGKPSAVPAEVDPRRPLSAYIGLADYAPLQNTVTDMPKEAPPRNAPWQRRAAEGGDAQSQYQLGQMYRDGNGCPRDAVEAAKWFRKAAETGLADAQNELGLIYLRGAGVSPDTTEAAKWFAKAAEQGHAHAQHALGQLYRKGSGVPQDFTLALRWFRRSANSGLAEAQNTLGLLYQNGAGVLKDDEEALRWFRKAAEQGYAKAQNNLGAIFFNSGSQVEGLKWFHRAAEQGDPESEFNLGVLHLNGTGVSQNHPEAAKWLRKAAGQGHTAAQYNLGQMYHHGLGVPQGDLDAYAWLHLATGQVGQDDAMVKVRESIAGRLTPEQIAEAKRRAANLVSMQSPDR